MPQFPIQPKDDLSASEPAENGVAKSERKPINFKRVQSKGPVTRVRLKGSSRSSSASKRNPFNDEGLFDDKESLERFRDDVGRPLLLTFVAIGLVCFIYWMSQPDNDTPAANKKMVELMEQVDNFEEQIPTSTTQFEERIKVADELLSLDDAIPQKAGAELKLKTLTLWSSISLESGALAPDLLSQLEKTSRQYINSRNNKLASNAKLGVSLVRVNEYLKAPDKKYFPEILEQFNSVAKLAKDDFNTANSLMKVAGTFENQGLKDESARLFQSIYVECSPSYNQKIAAIGLEARKRVSTSEAIYEELTALIENIDKPVNFPIDKIRSSIAATVKKEPVSPGKIEGILDFADLMMRKNAVPIANEILKEVSNKIYSMSGSIERDAIKHRYDDLTKMTRQFGQIFDFTGVFSVEGRPVSRTNLKQRAKIIVFWSPETPKSLELIEQLSRNYKLFSDRKIQVIAICHVSNHPRERNKILEISNATNGIDFLTLVKGKQESQAFSSRYPIPTVPYWILLNPDDRIQGLNTEIEFAGLELD